jgi:hypothetical protein
VDSTASGEFVQAYGTHHGRGRDPNDLINAGGLLPNDRPNIFRISTQAW